MKKLLIMLFVTATLMLAQTPIIVETAFDKMEADSIYQYRFSKIIQSTENTRLMKYNPAAEGSNCWELVSINENPPTKKELKAFYKEMSYNDDGNNKISFGSENMIDFSILSETDNKIEYSFAIDGDDKMTDKLTCTIALNKIDTTITKMSMFITETVSPILSVKLEEFQVDLVFDKIAKTGSTLLQESKTRIKGKALIFKEINENVTETYFDYEVVE